MADLTIDELSELECAILDACAEKRREGWGITPDVTFSDETRQCCPIGAFCGMQLGPDFATWIRFEELTGFQANGFDSGFDGNDYEFSNPLERTLYAMGQRFRERLELGEL